MKRILALFIIVFYCSPTLASEESIVFVAEEYPPYGFTENGQAKGIDVDIIRAVCERLGIEPVFEFMPWARAMFETKNGRADAIHALFKTAAREEFLYYPTELQTIEKTVVVVKDVSKKYASSIDDLKGWTIGVVANYSYGKEFDDFKEIERKASHSIELIIKQLASRGRVDAIIVNELMFDVLLKKLVRQNEIPDVRFRKLEYIPNISPLYVGFSKAKGEKNKQLANRYSQALKELREEGRINKIVQQYSH